MRALDSIGSTENFVVECQSSKSADQIKYHYNKYIYSDANDFIRKKLKYVKTPVILRIGAEEKITAVYFPKTEDVVSAELLTRIR